MSTRNCPNMGRQGKKWNQWCKWTSFLWKATIKTFLMQANPLYCNMLKIMASFWADVLVFRFFHFIVAMIFSSFCTTWSQFSHIHSNCLFMNCSSFPCHVYMTAAATASAAICYFIFGVCSSLAQTAPFPPSLFIFSHFSHASISFFFSIYRCNIWSKNRWSAISI